MAVLNLVVWIGLRRRRSMTLGARRLWRCFCGWMPRFGVWKGALLARMSASPSLSVD